MRFLVQWIYSEKHKESVIPIQFWYLSICGGIILIISIPFGFFNVGFLVFGIIIFVYGISRDLAKTSPNIGSKVLLVDDLADSGITLKKSIDWLEHFYGFYLDEKVRTGVLFYKSVSSFKPNYYIDYLEDSPWIHMPFEKYETTNIKDFKFEK